MAAALLTDEGSVLSALMIDTRSRIPPAEGCVAARIMVVPRRHEKTKRITPKLLVLVIEERGRCWPGKLQTPRGSFKLHHALIPFPFRMRAILCLMMRVKVDLSVATTTVQHQTSSSKQARTRKSDQNPRQTSPKLGFLDDRHHSLRRIQSWPGHLKNGASPHHHCTFKLWLAILLINNHYLVVSSSTITLDSILCQL
jgi:hypothetical protein